jgi:pimeloyl-ACP methyl ester carboxylesterase
MGISHWANRNARIAYEAAYRASLDLWPIPTASHEIATPFGATHVVVAGEPDGEPIVLIHAGALSATQWYLQAADLAAGHQVYAVDIMGDIGLSSQTRAIHTRAEAAAWLSAVLDGLGLDRAVLVGSSFGGFQSTNLAVHHPEKVAGLVLLAPAATLKPFKLLANLMIRSGSLFPMPRTVRPGLRGMMQGDLPDEIFVHQMEVGVAGFRYDIAGIYPSEIPDGELATIRCPTLVLVGDKEMIYDPDEATARAQRLIPEIEAEIVPRVGHLLGMQRPDIVNPRVLRFIASAARSLQPA